MPSSLVKYSNKQDSGEQKLFWGRVNAGNDSYPYRGPFAPTMRDDEFEVKAVPIADARNAFFDVTDAASNKMYLEVVECCCNGWFKLLHLERFWTDRAGHKTTCHYVEWIEYYMEDGTRTAYSQHNPMEMNNDQ